MRGLFAKLENPAVTNLTVKFPETGGVSSLKVRTVVDPTAVVKPLPSPATTPPTVIV